MQILKILCAIFRKLPAINPYRLGPNPGHLAGKSSSLLKKIVGQFRRTFKFTSADGCRSYAGRLGKDDSCAQSSDASLVQNNEVKEAANCFDFFDDEEKINTNNAPTQVYDDLQGAWLKSDMLRYVISGYTVKK